MSYDISTELRRACGQCFDTKTYKEICSLIRGRADVNANHGEPLAVALGFAPHTYLMSVRKPVVAWLLEAKADLIRNGERALFEVLKFDQSSCVELLDMLLKAGLDPNITVSNYFWSNERQLQSRFDYLDLQKQKNIALLDFAVIAGKKDLVDILLLHGAVTTTKTLEIAVALGSNATERERSQILGKVKHVLMQETVSREMARASSEFRLQHHDHSLQGIKVAIERLQEQVSEINTYIKSGSTGHHVPSTTPAHSLRLAVNQAEIAEVGFKPLQLFVDQPNTVYYGINEDSDPVHIVRPITPVTLKQNVRVRYLEPPKPPTPAPIIVKERQLTPPPPAPPIRVIMREPSPPTPPPLVIRENPPPTPKVALEPTIIEKIIPPPTPPPRQVILERIPAPDKPRDIIYEKWLPYKQPADRQVILERGKIHEKLPAPRNVIIDYEKPNVNVQRIIHNDGVIRVDPISYTLSQPNGELKIVDKIYELPTQNMHLQQAKSIPAKTFVGSVPLARAKSALVRGPTLQSDPWRSTYKTSYTGRGFGI